MVLNIYYKLNDINAISVALSAINTEKNFNFRPSIGEMQKKYGEFYPIALDQIHLLPKSSKKLSHFCEAGCLFEPRSFEQSTSQTVATWKARFFPSKKLLSLTGGLGVDDWAWAKTNCKVISCDPNSDLNELATYNFRKLDVQLERLCTTAEEYLESQPLDGFDLMYIDPDRRKAENRLHGKADEFQPNVSNILKQVQELNIPVLVKMSPLTDINWIEENWLGNKKFYAIMYQGEVKELLIYIDFGEKKPLQKEVVLLYETGYELFTESNIPQDTQKEKTYFFEPHAGYFCLNLHREMCKWSFLEPQNSQKTYFVSSEILPVVIGRTFLILHQSKGSLNQLQRLLSLKGITHSSVSSRECGGLKTEEIRKKLKQSDGGQFYIFVTKNKDGFLMYVTEKVISR